VVVRSREVVHYDEGVVQELYLFQVGFSQRGDHVPCEAVVVDLEGECGAARQATKAHVHAHVCLGEHDEVADVQHSSHTHKILQHILPANLNHRNI